MPKNEYQFPAKEVYREKVWGILSKNAKDVNKAKVLFFPGKHGLEIPIALSLGFKEENLIAVEENPAIIATSTWRKEYPRVQFYASRLDRAIERIKEDKLIIDAANLDYCSNICESVFIDLELLLSSPIIKIPFTLSITLFKGREGAALMSMARLVFNEYNRETIDRIKIIWEFIKHRNCPIHPIYQDEYKSGKTNHLVYGITKVCTHNFLQENVIDNFYRHYSQEVHNLLELDNKITEPQTRESFEKLQGEFMDRRNILDNKETYFSHRIHKYWESTPYPYFLRDWDFENLMRIGLRRHRELSYLQKLLLKTQAEKAQLLQSGLAYR